MFVCALKKRQFLWGLLGLLLFAVVVSWLVGALYRTAGRSTAPLTEADLAAYIESFGWEVEAIPSEQREVQIPEEWNDVYRQYNEIQLRQGFDLSDDLGRTVTVTTFVVTNYPDQPDTVRAHLLTAENKILAADICSLELDGFMHGLNENTPDSSAFAEAAAASGASFIPG